MSDAQQPSRTLPHEDNPSDQAAHDVAGNEGEIGVQVSDYSRWRHGFKMRTPQPAKSRSLRVASAMPCEAAMHAI
jgi:hypothetical protein